MKFREFLTSQVPNNYNLLSYDSLILEAVLNPGEIKLNDASVEYLNKELNKLNIYFEESNNLYGKTDGKDIYIYVPNDVKIEELQAMIGHEIIHREQHKRSSNFKQYTEKIVKEINDLAYKFNKTQDMKILEIREKLLNEFLYGNIYEQMAYAYQLVKDRKSYNLNSPDDVVKYFKQFLKAEMPKKFMKYVGMYWLIKNKL